jgi:hypothetical protein
MNAGEVTVVPGWQSVEELVRWGFERSAVVMMNEAHEGMLRCPRTRAVGVRAVRAAHEVGVRRLAMEALPACADPPCPVPHPPTEGGYLGQPDMQELFGTALELGWTLWAYDSYLQITQDTDPAELLTNEATNGREREQARRLAQLVESAPDEPLLVWCGNGHLYKDVTDWWVPMGYRFREMTGVDPVAIDQVLTVAFEGRSMPAVDALVESLADLLAGHGGTAGIVREEAPAELAELEGVDAYIVSTDNSMR